MLLLLYCVAGSVDGKVQCEVCRRYYHTGSLKRHVRQQHGANTTTAQCNICHTLFKNEGVMKDHLRRKHNFYATKAVSFAKDYSANGFK